MSRFATAAKRPMNISIAAGVAGTVAVTGTVVAVAAERPAGPKAKPVKSRETGVTAAVDLLARQQAEQVGQERRRQQQLVIARLAAAKAKSKARLTAARKAAAAQRAAEARKSTRASASRSFSRVDAPASASAAHVLDIAAAQSGDSYSYGAAGPDSFDCSGFTQYVFGKVGISLPHSSSAQRGVARPVSNPAPGDLVFVYNGGGGSIGHVAIYAGNGYWYEASNPSTGVGRHRAWSSNVSYGRVL